MHKLHTTITSLSIRTKHHVMHANWKKNSLYGGLGVFVVLMIAQLAYPGDRMLPFTRVDGMNVSMMKRSEATKQLNTAYASHPIAIYMGTATKPVTSPKLSGADLAVDNTSRLDRMSYPIWLRFIPTSIFWAGLRTEPVPKPIVGDHTDDFITKYLMPSCQERPVDATLRANGEKLDVVPAKNGGQCDEKDVTKSLVSVRPVLDKDTAIRVARKEIPPAVGDVAAKKLADDLMKRFADGMPVPNEDEAFVLFPAKELFATLDFSTKDDMIVATINTDRASKWLDATIAPKVAVKPGISYVTTRDFTEVSRQNGTAGQALDYAATLASAQQVIDGTLAHPSVVVKPVPPTEQYTRTYSPSDAGLSALMSNFAKDHPGTYGASMVELDGKKRRADYNGDKQFVTASTYKLFVAYSLLKQIDAGKRDWESNATCFNKMISLSDNACAESFLNSLGLKTVTDDIQGVGLKNSTFMKSGGPFTTANDLSLELGMIATGQNFSSVNQQRLVAAMKANVYRKGIPAGVNGTVADKVGFMDGLLHDAAIVYGPNGTYVLAIMTDGSSWVNIADLAKQLDALHAQ